AIRSTALCAESSATALSAPVDPATCDRHSFPTRRSSDLACPQRHAEEVATAPSSSFRERVQSLREFGFHPHRDHRATAHPMLLFACRHCSLLVCERLHGTCVNNVYRGSRLLERAPENSIRNRSASPVNIVYA